MAEQEYWRLRCVFRESGRLAMLSHLELARALERAVRRAGLPYAISQGFSPHMKIAFGSALPVGVGGNHEIFDVRLTSYVDPKQALESLQAASVFDLMVESCEYIGKRDPAASVALPISTYEVIFERDIAKLTTVESITVERLKKGKLKRRDIVVDEYVVDGPHVDGNRLTFTLESKPTGSLRPDVYVNEITTQADAGRIVSMMRTAQHPDAFAFKGR